MGVSFKKFKMTFTWPWQRYSTSYQYYYIMRYLKPYNFCLKYFCLSFSVFEIFSWHGWFDTPCISLSSFSLRAKQFLSEMFFHIFHIFQNIMLSNTTLNATMSYTIEQSVYSIFNKIWNMLYTIFLLYNF